MTKTVYVTDLGITLTREERRKSLSGPCHHEQTEDGRCSRWVNDNIPCQAGPPEYRYVSNWVTEDVR